MEVKKSTHFLVQSLYKKKIGYWSFSIYLFHQPLLNTLGTILAILNIGKPVVAGPPPPPPSQLMDWIICIGFIAVSLLVSYLT